MQISTQHFGFLPDGKEVKCFRIANEKGIIMELSDYGGTIISLIVPDKEGNPADIVLGYPNWEEWKTNDFYFNCLIGRTCNRIGGAKFLLDGKEYKVSANQGEFQLHGGFEGFHLKLWEATPFENEESAGLILEYQSVDGEEGFPGNLKVKAIYTLNNENEIEISFTATTDKPTPVNLTNHGYFNLGGEGSGDIYSHQLAIYADQITETNENSIPTGRLTAVAGTAFDFTRPKAIGERIGELAVGYDDNYVLWNQSGELSLAARTFEPKSGRMLEVFTTEPGVQLYTSNWFDGSRLGKSGKPHLKHCAFCLETQHFPDSMNHPEFPDVILRPGEEFKSTTIWKFSIADQITE